VSIAIFSPPLRSAISDEMVTALLRPAYSVSCRYSGIVIPPPLKISDTTSQSAAASVMKPPMPRRTRRPVSMGYGEKHLFTIFSFLNKSILSAGLLN
jgi:hypothetical protein